LKSLSGAAAAGADAAAPAPKILVPAAAPPNGDAADGVLLLLKEKEEVPVGPAEAPKLNAGVAVVVAGAPKAGVLDAAAPNAGAAVVGAPKGDAVLVKVPNEGRLCWVVVAGVAVNPNCPEVAVVVGAKLDPKGAGVLDEAPNAAPKPLDAVVVVVRAEPKPPPKTDAD
jgi:hypothetical protein